MKKEEFQKFVKSIILEVKKEKKDSVLWGDSTASKYRSDIERDSDTDASTKLVDEIDKIVKKIDKSASCVLDDHNDITAILPGVFRIRIAPKGAGIFDVEAFRNMTDRVYAIALSKEQIIDFVKVNFAAKKKGYVQSAFDKSRENAKDAGDKRSKDLPKSEPVDHKKVPDKDIEDAVKDKKDTPNVQMSLAEKPKRQEEYGVEKPENMKKAVAMSKKDVDSSHTIKKNEFGDTPKVGKKV